GAEAHGAVTLLQGGAGSRSREVEPRAGPGRRGTDEDGHRGHRRHRGAALEGRGGHPGRDPGAVGLEERGLRGGVEGRPEDSGQERAVRRGDRKRTFDFRLSEEPEGRSPKAVPHQCSGEFCSLLAPTASASHWIVALTLLWLASPERAKLKG